MCRRTPIRLGREGADCRWCGPAVTAWSNKVRSGYRTEANGKPVFLETLCGVLGEYAKTDLIETFTASFGARHPMDLAMLRGVRLVTAVETEDGRRWAESKIKTLMGDDKIAARFMRQDFFEFTPQFKLVIAGNHKPGLQLRGRGDAPAISSGALYRHYT